MQKIKVLGLAFLCGALAIGITKPAKAVSEAVTLSATPNPSKNSISLQWNSSDSSQKYSYMLYSMSDKDKEFQSIPAKSDVKVLNVYPDHVSKYNGDITATTTFTSAFDGKSYTVLASELTKMWMEKANSEDSKGYGRGHIQVDAVPLSHFNDAPSDTLHNPDGTYKYDVAFFGAWDCNANQDLSSYSSGIVAKFIDAGRGVLLGHDTAGNPDPPHTYFMNIAEKYARMYTWQSGFDTMAHQSDGTTVVLRKKGLLNNYPWNIGDVGEELTVPYSHSNNLTWGDVWLSYKGCEANDNVTYNGHLGSSNYYLMTWNNVAAIQTGHSLGQATPDEQKILANTLFYLAQITTDTSWNDHKGQDLAAPNKPVISSVMHNADRSRYTVNYSVSEDNGTDYQYYVEATGQSDGKKFTSATVPAKITSGIAGYKVIADHSPDTVVSGTAETASTSCSFSRPDGPTFYVHVAAVDNAGNVSDTATYFVDERISVSHSSSVTYKIDPDSSTPFTSAEIPITNNSAIPVKVFVKGLSNASGGDLALNNVSPAKYSDWSRLTIAQTKSDAAFGIRIKEVSTGPGTWSSISQGGTVYTASVSKTLLGTLNAKGTGTLILTADSGLAWDRQYAVFQNLSLVFES